MLSLEFKFKFLINKKTKATLIAVNFSKETLNTCKRAGVLKEIVALTSAFEAKHQVKLHLSGLPYIRTVVSNKIAGEFKLFLALAVLITAVILLLFFRSLSAVIFPLIVVGIGVVLSLGTLVLFGYKITLLTALIPPLIIVIGVPNAIFLINKYQQEVKKHGNQAKSLQRVISKVGNATLMTNVTTAAGFATFIFTKSQLLREFGIIASINILAIFVLALLIIPIIYSFLALPREKHLKHLERKWIDAIVSWMERVVRYHRIAVYITTIILIIASMIGIYMIKISGSIIEDMPKGKQFFKDIVFFEEEYYLFLGFLGY